ncbi:MAG: DUF4230 domain-containing protein [Bacteroidales bacterium]|nr:DUF4230 domain-containing protein [Bacteroidales bacterium]
MSKGARIPLRYLLPLTLLLAIVLVLLLEPRRMQRSRELEIERTAAIVEQVRSIGELSSAGFYEELVLTDRDESYFSELMRASGLSRLTGSGDFVIICKGRVRAGFDLTKIQESDFSFSGDTLRLILPPVEILDVVLNPADYEHFSGHRTHEETTGILLQAKQRLRSDALREGILDQAELSAEAHLRRLLSAMGYREVLITFSKEYPLRSGE